MKSIVKVIGIVAVASLSAAATVIVLGDEKVRNQVQETYETVKNTAREMSSIIADGIVRTRTERPISPIEKNQAWVEDQWEALGI